MATANQNLSSYNPETVPSAEGMKFALVVAEWNQEITFALMNGAIELLKKHGANENDIQVEFVPGTFELTAAARLMAKQSVYDAVIAIGCVIKGETPHFDYICQGVTQGVTQLNVNFDIPFIFGVLTTNNQQEALDRAGGKYGNKGDEAAITAIKMADLHKRFE